MFFIFPPGAHRIRQEFRKMDTKLVENGVELIPWTKNEYELLSFRQIDRKGSKRWFSSGKGTFISIFHEPLIKYNYQIIYGRSNLLIHARTSRWSFSYWVKSKFTEVAHNQKFFGKILGENRLMSGKRLLTKIEKPSSDYHPIHVGRRVVGELSDPKLSMQYNPKVFEFVKDMDEKEEILFSAISIYHLLRKEITKK